MGRALHREMAQTQGDAAAAQSLAGAGQGAEVVDRHDHRAGTVQHRSLHPRRMEHVGPAGTVRLNYLSARIARVA